MNPRTLASGLAGAALLTTALALTPMAGADELPPPSASPVSLRGADKVVTYAYRNRVFTDFGLRMVAGAEPFEIRATRASYDEPISTVWRRSGGDVALPAGTMESFGGLDDFVDLTLTRVSNDQVVKRMSIDGCFNGFGGSRTRPDAPSRSPYPWGCPWNPYTVGSVMGIQAGWSSPVLPEFGRPVRLGEGRYDVVATIDPVYAELFGIADEDASATTRLVVRTEDEGRRRPEARRTSETLAPAAASEPRRDSVGAMALDGAPDLRSLPAFHIQLNERGTAMRFAATVWNGGSGPLVVDGFRNGGDDHMDAYQYFYDGEGNETGYQEVGEFHFHGDNHQHWHFQDFARYRLLNTDRTLAVKSTKASFCLANTDAVDYTLPDADWQPQNTDLSSDCGGPEAQGLRQVLSNGSGDTYMQYRAGQAFRIKNLADGVYYIAVEANPFGTLVEGSSTNNDSLRKVRIGTNERTGKRWVRAARVGIIDETMPRFFR
ncbi:MAG: lysyl oxidase family protein [Nocardioides sp.]